ncbi:MAG: site-2 protease family protein [Acidobacteria bacterium]|nr:site-2 protease family protein [Acidobacteriota bacterium]
MSSPPPPLFPSRVYRLPPRAYDPGPNGGYAPLPVQLQPRKRKLWLHLLLFVLTVASTTLLVGPIYSASVLSILTAHEFGHYFAARYYHVPATLPYFIPFPIGPFGTMGAVIRMSPYIPNRRVLFDIAAAGPIAGLVLALPLSLVGLYLSQHVPIPDDTGNWISLGDPLIFRAMQWLLFGAKPENTELVLHPIAYAGWVGLFVTALNLLPISQLDGGHVNYALFGRRSKMIAGIAFLLLAIVTAIQGFQYVIMLLLLWYMGISHPPTMNDSVDLGPVRRRIGVLLWIVFVLCFTPAPFGI